MDMINAPSSTVIASIPRYRKSIRWFKSVVNIMDLWLNFAFALVLQTS